MMAPTHVFLSLTIAAPFALYWPEYIGIIAFTAVIGGLLPDADLFVGTHRKTTHAFWIPWIVSIPVTIGAVITGSLLLLVFAVFSLCFAFHTFSDVLGGGPDMNPWEQNCDRGVYNWIADEWVAPRHIITYDGSIGDLLLSGAIFIIITPLYLEIDWYLPLAMGLLSIALGYTVIRRRIPEWKQKAYEQHKSLRPILDFVHGEEIDESDVSDD